MNKRNISIDEIKREVSRALYKALSLLKDCIIWDAIPLDPIEAVIEKDKHPNLGEILKEYGRKVKGFEENGIERVNNFELLSKFYLPFLAQTQQIPMPYTEFVKEHEHFYRAMKKITSSINRTASGYPPLIVKKPIGESGGEDLHGGKRVEVFKPSFKLLLRTFSEDIILQEFVYPPLEIFRDGYIKDTRIVMINGEPSVWYMRRAKERLIDPFTNALIEYPPSKSRFLTNVVQGGTVEELPKELRDKSLEFARKVYGSVLKWGKFYREELLDINGEPRCGFCSIDLIYKSDGSPSLMEVDFYPDINACQRLDRLAYRFGKYLRDLSNGLRKPIVLNDFSGGNKLTKELIYQLEKMRVPFTELKLKLEEDLLSRSEDGR